VICAVLACARADGAPSAQKAIAANPPKSKQRGSADILTFQLTIIAVVTDIANPLFLGDGARHGRGELLYHRPLDSSEAIIFRRSFLHRGVPITCWNLLAQIG
jgi:hypothetical protein